MSRVKGKGDILTAKFHGKGASQTNFPQGMETTKDLVLLSIAGNEYCAGEFLGATIMSGIKNHQFRTLLIADEVYWHNLRKTGNDPSAEEIISLKQEANELGAQYFENNLQHFLVPFGISAAVFNATHPHKTAAEKIKIINNMAIDAALPLEIVCWKDWSERSNFNENKAKIMALYESNDKLKKSISITVEKFTQRQMDKGKEKAMTDSTFELWRARSKGYLTEESPTVMWIAACLGYNFVVYPGDMPLSFQATKDFFIVKKDHEVKNPFLITVENPNLFANWLDVQFSRTTRPPINTSSADVSRGKNPNSYLFFSPKSDRSIDDQTTHPLTVDIATKVLTDEGIGKSPQKNINNEVINVVNDITHRLFSLSTPEERKQALKILEEIINQVEETPKYTIAPPQIGCHI